MKLALSIFVVMGFISVSYAEETPLRACDQHHKLMKSIPHTKIIYNKNTQFRDYNNNTYNGCSVHIETKWSLVGKDFSQSSVLDLEGWEYTNYAADGPGSSTYKRIKGNLFCILGYNFSSYYDEKINELITGDKLVMSAKCAKNI